MVNDVEKCSKALLSLYILNSGSTQITDACQFHAYQLYHTNMNHYLDYFTHLRSISLFTTHSDENQLQKDSIVCTTLIDLFDDKLMQELIQEYMTPVLDFNGYRHNQTLRDAMKLPYELENDTGALEMLKVSNEQGTIHAFTNSPTKGPSIFGGSGRGRKRTLDDEDEGPPTKKGKESCGNDSDITVVQFPYWLSRDEIQISTWQYRQAYYDLVERLWGDLKTHGVSLPAVGNALDSYFNQNEETAKQRGVVFLRERHDDELYSVLLNYCINQCF